MDKKYIKYKFKYLHLKGGSSVQEYNVDSLIKVIQDHGLPSNKKISKLNELIKVIQDHGLPSNKKISKLKKLIKKDQNILNNINSEGLTPLIEAIKLSDVKICNLFVKNNVNVNQADSKGLTPLIEAWESKKYDICKILLQHKDIDINCRNTEGKTLLHQVVMNFILDDPIFINNEDLQFVIDYIIKNGDINARDEHDNTPLFYAIQTGNLRFICMLSGKKPEHNISKNLNDTILHIAARYIFLNNKNSYKILRYLEFNFPKLKDNLDQKNRTYKDILEKKLESILNNLIDIIQSYREYNIDKITKITEIIRFYPDIKNMTNKSKSVSPLMAAIMISNFEICKLLIDNNVDINISYPTIIQSENIKYDEGLTPLMLAWIYDNYDICKILLESGRINIDYKNTSNGYTILHYLAEDNKKLEIRDDSGNLQFVIDYIIENGDKNAKDNQDRTPLDIAENFNNLVFIAKLAV